MAAIKRALEFFLLPLVVLLAVVMPANAEDYALVQGYLHSFNNNINVYTGVFALNKDLSLDTSVYVKYNIDIISPDFESGDDGGSSDSEGDDDDSLYKRRIAAVSGASGIVTSSSSTSGGGSSSSAEDTRHDILAGVTHNFNNFVTAEAYFDYSTESDYTSRTPTITLKKELFEKNTTLTLGYSRNIDTVNGALMDNPEDKNTDNFFLGVTQVLSPVAIGQLGYSRSVSNGFQGEGLRIVPLDDTDPSTCTAVSSTCVQEVFPDSRTRNAYLAGINYYFIDGLGGLLDRSSIKLTLRYYDDDWDINSYTGEAEYSKYLTENWLLRLNYRYYTQSEAFFIKDKYTATDEFKSSSPQLVELDSNLVGVKLAYLFKDEGMGDVNFRVGALEGKYEYYTESIGVNAHILMAAFRVLF